MDNLIFKQEKEKLQQVVEKITDARKFLEKSLTVLGEETLEKLKDLRTDPESGGMDFLMYLEQLHQKHETFNIKDKYKQLDELSYLESQPYFARIDLAEVQNSKKIDQIYIGKFGYTEENPVVTDWRAKIASVFYRYRYPQKNVKYSTPDGEVVRDLTLKRTYEIDEGELIKYFNNDLQLDESEIIAEKIEKRTGGVLEDIIETIQESQLDIIESDPRRVTIVQGSVGSGKSTVAIHKLSHIFFNYPELIKPERSILIAKNQILVSYLSTLFPKLGIFNINYKTLKDLMVNVVFREKINIKMDLDDNSFNKYYSISEIKELKNKINKLIEEVTSALNSILESEEFESYGGFVFSDNISLNENIEDLMSELNEELDFQKERLKDNPNSVRAWIFKENIKTINKLLSKIRKIQLELKDKQFPNLIKELGIKTTKEKLNYNQSLIYLVTYAHIFGINSSYKYQYCVVDEGQDCSLLEYAFLNKVVIHGRFCVLGDLNQGYTHEGITTWEDIKQVITSSNEYSIFKLTTNYRSTRPIIEFANKILLPFTSENLPDSINRKGSEPETRIFETKSEMFANFDSEITQSVTEISKSIGIIVYEESSFDEVVELLKSKNIPAENLILLDSKKRITYIPRGVYVTRFSDCKGLEFAKVYVLGLNLKDITEFKQAKKAFVAVTRAMDELTLYGYENSN